MVRTGGHFVVSAGQRVRIAGHVVLTTGHVVSATGQRVRLGGHFVSTGGHFVSAASVHWVSTGGHFVTLRGQREWIGGHLVIMYGHLLTSAADTVILSLGLRAAEAGTTANSRHPSATRNTIWRDRLFVMAVSLF